MPNKASSRSSRRFSRTPAAFVAMIACIAAPAMYASVRMSADAHTTVPTHHGAIIRQADMVQVQGAWSRPAIDSGVVYCTVRNTSNHTLTLVGVTTSRAAKASLHESYTVNPRSHAGTQGMAGHDMAGMAGHDQANTAMSATAMRPLKSIDIPAHGIISFKAGGRHIMLDGLRGELHRGQTFAIKLHFKNGVTQIAAVQVR